MSALPSVLSRLNVELRASFCGSKLDAVWYSLLKRGELAIFGNDSAQQYTPEGMLELELLCCSRRVVAVRKTESKDENEWAAVSSVDRASESWEGVNKQTGRRGDFARSSAGFITPSTTISPV
jgi:hypothetical protein